MEDHLSIANYFDEKIGNFEVDWLGLYRKFMDRKLGKSTETEWRWANPIVFEEEHLQDFINSWTKEDES